MYIYKINVISLCQQKEKQTLKLTTMTQTQTIEFQGVEMDVTFDYQAEEPHVFYMSNGDPGYPGCAASAEIEEISIGGVECTELLEKHWQDIEDQLLNN